MSQKEGILLSYDVDKNRYKLSLDEITIVNISMHTNLNHKHKPERKPERKP